VYVSRPDSATPQMNTLDDSIHGMRLARQLVGNFTSAVPVRSQRRARSIGILRAEPPEGCAIGRYGYRTGGRQSAGERIDLAVHDIDNFVSIRASSLAVATVLGSLTAPKLIDVVHGKIYPVPQLTGDHLSVAISPDRTTVLAVQLLGFKYFLHDAVTGQN